MVGEEPFGQEAVARASLDGWHGATIYNTPFHNDGTGGSASITSWRFYCDNAEAVGRSITPLLVESVGGQYIVRGIGATRTVNSTGLQSYDFDVQSGTDTFDRAADPQFLPVATVRVVGTTTLRAAAFKSDYQPTNVDTQTYLFTADIVRQGVMSSAITNHAVWGPQMEAALLAVPTVSLVTSNTISLTEAQTSIELIMPDGSPGF